MPRLAEVSRYVRSKNAGPFWITVDIFFNDRAAFDRWSGSPALSAEAIARAYGVDPGHVRRHPAPDLDVLKLSFPRREAQGGELERDMHAGQSYVRLLDLELG